MHQRAFPEILDTLLIFVNFICDFLLPFIDLALCILKFSIPIQRNPFWIFVKSLRESQESNVIVLHREYIYLVLLTNYIFVYFSSPKKLRPEKSHAHDDSFRVKRRCASHDACTSCTPYPWTNYSMSLPRRQPKKYGKSLWNCDKVIPFGQNFAIIQNDSPESYLGEFLREWILGEI